MRTKRNVLRVLAMAAMVAVILPSALLAKGSDVVFRGKVTRVDRVDDRGSVVVRLDGSELRIEVNAETEVESHGNPLGLARLEAGDFVKVAGVFSSSGIIAREVQVLDSRTAGFRLQGRVSEAAQTSSGVVMMVSGVRVIVDNSTSINRRGTDDAWRVTQLQAGMEVDIHGRSDDGRLTALTVSVGERSDDGVPVRFDGKVEKVEGNRLFIDTQGGGTAVVVMDDSTNRMGTVSSGHEVEVRGRLNEKLEVEAHWVKSDDATAFGRNGNSASGSSGSGSGGSGSGGSGGGNPGGVDDNSTHTATVVRKAIVLSAAQGLRIEGEAEIEIEQEHSGLEQQFEVEIEKAMANAQYRISVDVKGAGSVEVGSLMTDSTGRARVKFSTKPGVGTSLVGLLPAGKTVADIAAVRVLLGGAVVLSGRF